MTFFICYGLCVCLNIINYCKKKKRVNFKEACQNGNLELVKKLHQKGADCSDKIHKPILKASKNGHLEIVKYLHENGANLSVISFVMASKNGHLEVVKYLHSHGDINTLSYGNAICKACMNGHIDVVRFILNYYQCNINHILWYAYAYGQFEVLKYFIHNGAADINQIKCESMKKKAKEYIRLKWIMDECITRIHFHPDLERTRTENLEKLLMYNNQLKKKENEFNG